MSSARCRCESRERVAAVGPAHQPLIDRLDGRPFNHVAAHWKEALNQFSLFFEDRLSIR